MHLSDKLRAFTYKHKINVGIVMVYGDNYGRRRTWWRLDLLLYDFYTVSRYAWIRPFAFLYSECFFFCFSCKA